MMTPEERDFICYDCPHHGKPMYMQPCCQCANGFEKQPKKSYWERIYDINKSQEAKGIATYGQTLEENQLPDVITRIHYLQEELLDAMKYMCWIEDEIERFIK